MKHRVRLAGFFFALGVWMAGDLLACGDKFLVSGRGTRYQRPKNARAASVLIYANPATGLQAALNKLPIDSVLKHEGHRATTVEAPEQLSAIVTSGHFDVVLVASGDAASVEKILGTGPDAPVVVALCVKSPGLEPASDKGVACLKTPPKEGTLLEAIDKAVERHDQNLRKAQART
jgi:hypothetical protein